MSFAGFYVTVTGSFYVSKVKIGRVAKKNKCLIPDKKELNSKQVYPKVIKVSGKDTLWIAIAFYVKKIISVWLFNGFYLSTVIEANHSY